MKSTTSINGWERKKCKAYQNWTTILSNWWRNFNMKNPWKTISSKVVHKNKWFSVRKDNVITPSGKPGEYNVVESSDSVFIIALNSKKEIAFINLYRYPTQQFSLELPAGHTDNQKPLV